MSKYLPMSMLFMNKSHKSYIHSIRLPPEWAHSYVPAVNKVLRASIFLHLRNFETERYTQENHEIKSFDLQEINDFDFSFSVVSRFVPKLRKFEKLERAIYFWLMVLGWTFLIVMRTFLIVKSICHMLFSMFWRCASWRPFTGRNLRVHAVRVVKLIQFNSYLVFDLRQILAATYVISRTSVL